MTHEERLSAIFNKLDELTVAVTTQSAVCGQCGPRVAALEATVKGNGRVGILTRLRVVEVVLTCVAVMFVSVAIPLCIGVGQIWATMHQPPQTQQHETRVAK